MTGWTGCPIQAVIVATSAVFHQSVVDFAGRHACGCLAYQSAVNATDSVAAGVAAATVG
jgi:hypothetical protein